MFSELGLTYSPREVLVLVLPDAQTASDVLPPNEELTSIWKDVEQKRVRRLDERSEPELGPKRLLLRRRFV